MTDPSPGFMQVINDLKDQLALLALAGVAGGFFRAIMAPEKQVQARIIQGVGGALSAIFLGGIMAHITNTLVNGEYWSFLAWGFIMGNGGEVAVKIVQDKLTGGKK